MKRRSFIAASGLGISALAFSALALFGDLFSRNSCARPVFLSQLCDDETLRLLGRAYVNLTPEGRNKEILMKQLYGKPVDVRSLRQSDILSMQEEVEDAISRDFNAGRTLALNGWILSVTEARQCALFAIINP